MNFEWLKKFCIMTSFVAVAACQEGETSQLDWGHIKGSSLEPAAPQYLINQKPGDSYRVCVPKYMLDELPGLRSEITAAVNIWAHYLGRNIPVEIISQPLPRMSANSRPDQLRNNYYQSCGSDVDVVLGLVPLPGTTVGQTGSTWRTNYKGEVTSFQRHVVLRDYRVSPDPYGRVKSWISLQELTGKSYTSSQLLNIMKQRGQIEVDPKGRSLTFPVLVHEFGHVWGLCDQYEGPSNCDPRHSSRHPALDSIMAASSSINKIYLTDDDITGIRELAKRPGFNVNWPGTTRSLTAPPKPLSTSEVQFFEIKDVARQGQDYLINFGLLTRRQGGELRIQYRPANSTTWKNARTYFPSQKAFRIADHTLKLGLPYSSQPYRFRLALNLRLADNGLSAPIYKYQ
ncbi:MAG: hypothetical protein ACOH5I_00470 [Oligoflexus sp.]